MIRPLHRGDLPHISTIEQACFGSNAWSETSLAWSLEDPLQFWLGYFENNILLGYVSVQCICGVGDITNVAVTPPARGRGIGGQLLLALDGLAREQSLEELTLEVRQSNLTAIRLYTRAGYTQVGKRPNYYENPREGAILMTKYYKGSDGQ